MTAKKDYFKTFCKISKAIGSTLKREDLLDLIVASAIETMDAKAASLFLEDKKKDVFVSVCQRGLSESYLHSDPYRMQKMSDELMKNGYLAFEDVATDERIQNRQAKIDEGISSILVVPVRVEGKNIGVLSLYTADARRFSPDEIEFLGALAEQGGVAIQNSRLLRRITRNSYLFHDLADSINSTNLDIKQILHIMTADIAEAFEMKGVIIRLLNKDTNTLDIVASYGFSEEFLNKGPVHPDKSITQALKGETVVIRNAADDERIEYRDAMKTEGIVSMLVVPIQAGGEIIGVMRLCTEEEREFSEDMIVLVEALAHQGGLAIQNASLYLSLQEDKSNLEKDIWSHRQWF
ncbi:MULTISPECIES: GAF domain-containing protein [Desulfococcus]|jgi:GAF domain-containing protein|uniref:Putative GAF sensor protein n=1 Tax=Desulfococcus multivorans DSM 2059 TaxID=1121405 RepID=S7VBW4_DESML|nr:GAF domain-containing protein [Desulfococcus multivorans]AOY57344.1 GAF domain protein [Desulfococcus multivorans]AQU99790.1 diguanylate cyclase [Desulfococcus multivorans]EPR41973.1 putative GAF sensor protein [Desulfococcus multivorans DSM 2059]MDX9819996.1 GAF domain-containing protein [Desulfococcus multivorans]SKA10756.1 GAF domain-containing protein [Desulfococcus multivorans DSM 2059]